MKILHTADLHIGQILYQNYDRYDEYEHFFQQLMQWCQEEKPDALLVSGDVFDIQQPSTTAKKLFNDQFVRLQKMMPDMHIVVIAGNHDSGSRIHADHPVWTFSNTHLLGLAPSLDAADGWQDDYIIELPCGFIIALPYMIGDRSQQLQSVLDRVSARNADHKPVVMMAHLAVTGSDFTGHDSQIGNIKTQDVDHLGSGYDYLALGHIHKAQTIGCQDDSMVMETVVYPAPVIRYAGSALHVSCDETYPHTVSVVEIDRHGGQVSVRQLRIDELRHFYTLPEEKGKAYATEEKALEDIKVFCNEHERGYIRLKMDFAIELSSNFNQQVYDLLATNGNEIRFNPKIIWMGQESSNMKERARPVFEVSELQQMKDPLQFILKTKEQYAGLDFDTLSDVFKEVEEEIRRHAEEEANVKTKKKTVTVPSKDSNQA